MPLLPPSANELQQMTNYNGGDHHHKHSQNNQQQHFGSVIIKARLGGDVRKFTLNNSDISRDELLLTMQRVFKGRITPTDDVVLKYTDQDGDLITIAEDNDLTFAIRSEPVLKVVLLLNNADHNPTIQSTDLKSIRDEVVRIRDSSNKLLDSLLIEKAHRHTGTGDHKQMTDVHTNTHQQQQAGQVSPAAKHYDVETSREFDPLNRSGDTSLHNGPVSFPDKPPNVYGVGNNQDSRPDTPNSQISRRSGSLADSQAQENVATIQPTVHQQMGMGAPAAHPAQPYSEPPQPPPVFSSQSGGDTPNPTPPIPPAMTASSHGQQQMNQPPTSMDQQHQYGMQPPPSMGPPSIGGPPTPASTPTPQQQQQQLPPASSVFAPVSQHQQQQHQPFVPPPPNVQQQPQQQQHNQPPQPFVSMAGSGGQQQQQHPPPPSGYSMQQAPPHHQPMNMSGTGQQSDGGGRPPSAGPPQQFHQQQQPYSQPPQQQQQQQHPAPPMANAPPSMMQQQQQQPPPGGVPPPPSLPGSGGPPPMGPPGGFPQQGGNPFARAPNPYARPQFQ